MQDPLFNIFFIPVSFLDIIDIFLVTAILYRAYQIIQGTTASRMLIGLILILSLIVQLFNMEGMMWLVDQIRTVWVIVFVIIFQPELRRILTSLGQGRLLKGLIKIGAPAYVDEIVQACELMAKRRNGAIIVIAQTSGLKNIIETGLPVQATVSHQLLQSIFNPRSPMHDGAVIIDNEQIEAAKCLLPLSQNPYIESSLGTRHRAAMGVSEQTDAIAVVVSEETGKISVAYQASLQKNITPADLSEYIQSIISRGKTPKLISKLRKKQKQQAGA